MNIGAQIINEITIDTGRLNQDIERLYQLELELKTCETNMKEEIAALNDMWNGSAQKAFNIQFSKDCLELDELRAFLGKYTDAMDKARDEYNKCSKEAEELINSINI